MLVGSGRVGAVTAAAAALALASSTAFADAGDAGEASDVRALEQQLAEEHAALSTADCNAACRALGSIRRAADKICALEPGPRCDSAREKAADATRRVRDACPDCEIARAPLPTPAPERAAARDERAVATAEPPPEPRGGCRSCSATENGATSDLGTIVLAVFGAARLAGRRSKRDRRRT